MEPAAKEGIGTLLRNRRYVLYLVSRVALMIAMQMLAVAVGWQVYEITHQALALGFSGLALFLPAFVLALPGGHVADRLDRRWILLVCHFGSASCAATLAILAYEKVHHLFPIYAVLCMLGTIRAFSGAAGQAFMPSLVEKHQLGRAVAFASSCWQMAIIAGPSLGGMIYAVAGAAAPVYAVCAVLASVAVIAMFAIGKPPQPIEAKKRDPASLATLLAGIRYVWADKPILGSISLDLFAVLLGGAVALLPIYARDILRIGPWGLGLLRTAPAMGALLVALVLAWFPLKRRAGVMMLLSVLVFGIATIGFGFAREFPFALAMLLVLGGADMISVVVRSTLVQVRTPDEMRGRVSAVNMVFVGASNELGEFESGVTAAWLGPERAVIVGGVGTCIVVVLWAILFPALRKIDRLD